MAEKNGLVHIHYATPDGQYGILRLTMLFTEAYKAVIREYLDIYHPDWTILGMHFVPDPD